MFGNQRRLVDTNPPSPLRRTRGRPRGPAEPRVSEPLVQFHGKYLVIMSERFDEEASDEQSALTMEGR